VKMLSFVDLLFNEMPKMLDSWISKEITYG
jgi:hypothetical protein